MQKKGCLTCGAGCVGVQTVIRFGERLSLESYIAVIEKASKNENVLENGEVIEE